MKTDRDRRVTPSGALKALYGAVAPPSIVEGVDHVHPIHRPFIETAPFARLATSGPKGLDATPRGDPADY